MRLTAIYHIKSDARAIEARAHAIAIEQSVEVPIVAIDDPFVRDSIVGQVEAIEDRGDGVFEVCISFSAATVGYDLGHLLNILFGNSSLHEDVELHDVELPPALVQAFGGPRHGLDGLRQRVKAPARALTCAALKPQGLPASRLAALAHRLALGGIDYVKDDHGLADQAYSPFAARVEAIVCALQASGGLTQYVPSLCGDLDQMRSQVALARQHGVGIFMIAPMIVGLSNLHKLVQENPDVAFIAHPTLGGACRIAPPLLYGKLFRLAGADGFIFPNHGGRFGYSRETCMRLARSGLGSWHGLKPSVPIPAGGMSRERVPEMLDFYGGDVMLLLGGALLQAGERLVEETAAFVAAVRDHRYR